MTQNRGRFCSKRMFCAICGHFLRSVAAHRLSNVSFRKSFRFPAKPTDFVIARRAFSMPDAAICNGTRRHPGTRHGKACAMSPCDKSKFRDYVVLCPRASPRDAIPLALRLPRRCAPRNDTESGRFFSKRMFCAICGHFLRSVAALRLSNVPFRKSFRFPAKPTDFVIARRAFSMPDAAI